MQQADSVYRHKKALRRQRGPLPPHKLTEWMNESATFALQQRGKQTFEGR